MDSLVTDLRSFINDVNCGDSNTLPLLPISHIPRVWKLGEIVRSRKLETNDKNKHYETEQLVFFYYGKAIFLTREQRELQRDINPPIVFLFDITKISTSPKRLLPFDSGAFSLYNIRNGISVKDFEIDSPNITEISKLLCALFKNLENYLDGKPDFNDLVNDYIFFQQLGELNSLYNNISTKSTSIGPEGITFEIHYGDPIPLAPSHVFIPFTYSTSKKARAELSLAFPKEKCDIYYYHPHRQPHVNIEIINALVKDIIKSKKN